MAAGLARFGTTSVRLRLFGLVLELQRLQSRMLKNAWLMLFVGCCGCSTTDLHEDAGSAGTEPVCDGSQEIRLTWSVSGGFVPETWFFTNPYGSSFFAIDGECHYFAVDNYMRGYMIGTLSSEQGRQLNADLAFGKLHDWIAAFQTPTSGCPDASLVSLQIDGGSIGCICGCPQDAPAGLSNALYEAGNNWLERLLENGHALTGPVSAIALSNGPDAKAIAPVQSDAWPLSQPISSIPDLLLMGPSDPRLHSGPYARFEDSDSATKLRALRQAAYERQPKNPIGSIFATEGDKSYALYVRDEPSAELTGKLEAFKRSAGKP